MILNLLTGGSMRTTLESLLNGTEYRRLSDQMTAEIRKKYGLRKIDLQILYYLNKSGIDNTPSDILSLNLFTKGHISQSIKRLVNKGLLITEKDKYDKRIFHCILTEQSQDLIRLLDETTQSLSQKIFDHVSLEEKEIFLSIADRINKNILSELKMH